MALFFKLKGCAQNCEMKLYQKYFQIFFLTCPLFSKIIIEDKRIKTSSSTESSKIESNNNNVNGYDCNVPQILKDQKKGSVQAAKAFET